MKIIIFTIACTFFYGYSFCQGPDYEFHYIEKDANWITSAQQTTLSDINNDGNLDFTTGNVHNSPSLYWYEYVSAKEWKRHVIGSVDGFYGGAVSMNVNNDGQSDIISSEYLFINKRGQRGIGWDKFFIGTGDENCHCMIKTDLNQDERMDVITNSGTKDKDGLCWYEMPADPTQPWIRHEIGGRGYWAHGALDPMPIGDFDRDGDNDVAAAGSCFENLDGKGTKWKEHHHGLIGTEGPWGMAVKTYVVDMNGNGYPDVVQAECDLRDEFAGLGWLGDVDADGDLDIVSKEWTSGSIYYLENKLIN